MRFLLLSSFFNFYASGYYGFSVTSASAWKQRTYTLNAIYRTILHPIILCTHTSNLCLRYILLRFSQTSGLKMSPDKRSC